MFEGHRILISAPARSGGIAAARAFRESRWTDPAAQLTASLLLQRAGLVQDALLPEPPYRAPHHTVSEAGLVGGGITPRPGEVSLAHGGTLLLDEIECFHLGALDALFRALDAGEVRFRDGTVYPARPRAVIARIANPKTLPAAARLGNGWFTKGR